MYNSKILYREEVVISAGLNIILTDQICLCDLLRVEFQQELRIELVEKYLQHIIPRSTALIFKDSSCPPMNSITLLPDWGLLLTFPDMKVAINAEHAQYSSVYYDCEYPKSLIAVSICAEVTLWDSSGTIQGILLKASNSHSISRLKSDIHSYVYSISKVTAKNLLMKYSEAKDLFFTDSIQSSNESLRKSGDLPPIAKRNPHVRLFQNDSLEGSPIKKSQEITESFEYSVSDETEKYGKSENIEKVATKGKKNYNFTLKRDSLEVESPRFTSLESMENDKGILNNVRVRTPEASPRQFECPSHQVKFILKLKDSNVDMITSKSMDLEKTTLKTTITEPSHKLEDRASCYNCEVCYIF